MSNIQSTTQTKVRISGGKSAAVIAWLGSVATTYLFLAGAMASTPWLLNLSLAFVLQWALTMAERPLWRALMGRNGGRFVPVGIIVTLLDGIVNGAGIYPFIGSLAQSNVGKMLIEVFRLQPTVSPQSAFIIALVLGLIIAALPEALWESG